MLFTKLDYSFFYNLIFVIVIKTNERSKQYNKRHRVKSSDWESARHRRYRGTSDHQLKGPDQKKQLQNQ